MAPLGLVLKPLVLGYCTLGESACLRVCVSLCVCARVRVLLSACPRVGVSACVCGCACARVLLTVRARQDPKKT